MDIVLGMSMTPSAVRMVLVEGENADGPSLDHDAFEIVPGAEPATSDAPQQVLDAILGTRESAAEGGHRLTSVGVAWTDHTAAARLRQGLRQHRLHHDVVLVSELHAASALAQAIGQTVGSQDTALLFVERDTATLAVVRTADGTVIRVISRSLPAVDPVTELQGMVAGLDAGDEPAQAVFMVGSGVDIAALEPHIAAATDLPVHAPADGDLALARGAALAAASTPRYEASTVGMVSSEDTVAGVTQMAAAGYMAPLGYSAVPDDEDEDPLAYDGPAIAADVAADVPAEEPGRKSFVLVGSALSTFFVIGVAALAVSLAVVIRPTGDQRPEPGRNPVVSSVPAPVPTQAKDAAPSVAPETIQAPIPVVQEAPRTVVVAPPAARSPAPIVAPEAAPAPVASPPAPAPAAAPAPAPAAPAPAPAPARVAPPVVLPVPILLPPIFQGPVRTAPTPQTPSTTATYPTYPSTATSSPAPNSSSSPTSTPPATTTSSSPSNSNPPATTPVPSSEVPQSSGAGSGSTGSGSADTDTGSGETGSGVSGGSSGSGKPLWPLWPVEG